MPSLRRRGLASCKPCRGLWLFLPRLLRWFMCLNFWRRWNLPCGPFPALLIFRLSDFAAGLPDELLLCPARALSEYIARTSSITNRPRRLFVSPRNPSRAMSKNGISFLLREVIVHSGASPNDAAAPRAHSIRGIATSSAFFRNWSLSSVLEAASWRSNTVFTSFFQEYRVTCWLR